MSDHGRAVRAMLNGGYLYELPTDQLVALELEVSRALAERYLKETRGQGAPGTFFREDRERTWGIGHTGRAILVSGRTSPTCAKQVHPDEIDGPDYAGDTAAARAVRGVNPGEVWRVNAGGRRDVRVLVVDFDLDRQRWRTFRLDGDGSLNRYSVRSSRVHMIRLRDFRHLDDRQACVVWDGYEHLVSADALDWLREQLDGPRESPRVADAIDEAFGPECFGGSDYL